MCRKYLILASFAGIVSCVTPTNEKDPQSVKLEVSKEEVCAVSVFYKMVAPKPNKWQAYLVRLQDTDTITVPYTLIWNAGKGFAFSCQTDVVKWVVWYD